jgi:hypothetical protein
MKKITKKTTKKIVKSEITPVKEKNCCCKNPKKMLAFHLIGLLILVAILGGCFYKFGVVAMVNGTPIYRWSYLQKLQKADTSVLDGMVQKALILGEAKKKGVVIDQKDIDTQIASIEAQVKEQGMTLDEAMKSEGVTKEDITAQIAMQKIAEKLASPSAAITQAQIDDYLKTNKAYLPTGKTPAELQDLAKKQLETQAKNTSLSTWYNDLKSSAKIIYNK